MTMKKTVTLYRFVHLSVIDNRVNDHGKTNQEREDNWKKKRRRWREVKRNGKWKENEKKEAFLKFQLGKDYRRGFL